MIKNRTLNTLHNRLYRLFVRCLPFLYRDIYFKAVCFNQYFLFPDCPSAFTIGRNIIYDIHDPANRSMNQGKVYYHSTRNVNIKANYSRVTPLMAAIVGIKLNSFNFLHTFLTMDIQRHLEIHYRNLIVMFQVLLIVFNFSAGPRD